jgi:hypothetical protein
MEPAQKRLAVKRFPVDKPLFRNTVERRTGGYFIAHKGDWFMSSTGTPVFRSDYEHNPGVVTAWMSSYPNNPGVMTVWMSNYEHNQGVMKIYMTTYEHNQGVQKIYLSGCFPENELVLMSSDAYTPIGSLKVGNKISSWDVEQKKVQYTAVTGVHRYTVNDIMCFNNTMRVSSSHPLMVVESNEDGIFVPKWKVAFDVSVGDYVVGAGGKLVAVKAKGRHWHDVGTEVLNLSTDGGAPFFVGNCVVRAENATDNIEWADTDVTQKLWGVCPKPKTCRSTHHTQKYITLPSSRWWHKIPCSHDEFH